MDEKTQLAKNDDPSHAVTVSYDAIRPPTEPSEKTSAENAGDDPVDNEPVITDPEQAGPSTRIQVEPPLDGGYGWVCVMCVFLVNTHTWGINSVGLRGLHAMFDLLILVATWHMASDLDFAFIGGLSLSMAQFIAPVATITTRKSGTKTTLVLGIILQTAALLGASWSTKIWQLFLSQGVCFGFGMGMQFSATVGIIPQWFGRRRSLANGIATAGSGIGGLIYSLAADTIIQRWGTGWAFRILAIVSAAASGFSTVIIRDRNKAIGAVQIAFHASLLKRPEFLLTLAWGCFSVLGYVLLLFSLPGYANAVGLTVSQGSILGAMFNLGGGLGRPVMGYVSDIFGRINTALVCTFLAGLFAFVIWIFGKSFGVLVFYGLIGGAVSATYTTTVAPVGAEVVGLKLLPSALSIFWLSVVIPSTFAEPIALWLRTDNGTNFLHAQVFTGCMYMGAAISLLFVRAWKISELQATGSDGDPAKWEAEIRNNDTVPPQPVMARTTSKVPSVAIKAKAAKALFTMAKV
ncbi:MFS transporter (Mch2), putative [Talaromyces stipitatus ATCC 10500]|uniref:MFS transporter (Mch2), putative n=1 Tax=Talaromyces stipitatus (strain ATCC 10500 / CBS 375.48 / QM 6759 / NRRL 1006) TaxID=441959 RepID=B8MJC1_TALSN|nr:MFS transporter (Mch2), putative [Talaromyces stipitatus ATCC 10500]EED14710.1 MFS transporter (Mch2), putative [Talaromyces stipitatus ATCC 10500]